ncbi:hypothetical protein [Frigoriglobus tundricola]|uniref:PEP-CTERM protein-sorting domain-containing protein n=1 Tax=Frigoriglobus tundricola TaxID=2774151 RepID=A0A6M5Z276_9BACT|nr:hypothetical protein [Frigoriglobus tundricola]QJX00156.1 hypothetical protein FTUN_7780 [Frigoriglobus tundricola]
MKTFRGFAICAKALVAAAAIGLNGSPARADLEISLNQTASNTAQGVFVYDVSFNNSLDNGTPAERLQSGNSPTNFTTLYDIAGFKSATLNSKFDAIFSLTTPLTGQTPAGVTPVDSPLLTNVSLTYIDGGTTTAQTYSQAFTVYSFDTGVSTDGQYTSQVTKNIGGDGGTAVGSIGSVSVPVIGVPEPSGVVAALAGLPCMGLVVGFARRRRGANAPSAP